MMLFSVPSDFKKSSIDKYYEWNKLGKQSGVYETYGQYSVDNLYPSGRLSIPKINFKEMQDYIKYSSEAGINFNYLLNGSCMNNIEFTRNGIKEIQNFLDLLFKSGVRTLTVSLPPLMEIIKSSGYEFEIIVSTINQVNNLDIARYYENIGVKRIVVSESLNRNFPLLSTMQNNLSCNLEVIVNSICFLSCPFRNFHYNQIALDYNKPLNETSISYYTNRCLLRRMENKKNYLKLSFIRPEDLVYYSNVGIKFFKIQGRQAIQAGNILKTVMAYLKGDYNGNLLELLNCFVMPNNSEIYIDNKNLDGFILKFLENDICKYGCTNCNYCDNFIENSMRCDDGILNVISKHITNNDLFLKELDI